MAIQTIEVQRFSLTTSRSFEAVVASLKAGVGQLDLAAFANASKSQGTFAELEQVINRNMGKTGLMLFLEFDHGAVVRKETGLEKPKIVRLVIGNPIVMKEMAKHVPDAGSYAPITVLVDERARWRAFVLRQNGQLSGAIRKPGCFEGRSGIGREGREIAQRCRG